MKKLSLAVALAVSAMGAQALTVTSSFTNALSTTEINQSGTLAKFDSSLGTLTDVVLTLNGAMTTSLSVTNSAAQSQVAIVNSNVDLSFNATITGLNAAVTASSPLALAVTTGRQTLGAGATQLFGPLNATNTITLDAQLDALFASFSMAGGGNFGVSCTSLSGLGITGGGGNVAASQSTQASCGASIVYTYTAAASKPVPEPASLALVGLALAAAGAATMRRKV
jgi:hypothetical protein